MPRNPLSVPGMTPEPTQGAPRLRDAPVSPVKFNFHHENWAQPSNADIEHASQQHILDAQLVERTRQLDLHNTSPRLDLSGEFDQPLSSEIYTHGYMPASPPLSTNTTDSTLTGSGYEPGIHDIKSSPSSATASERFEAIAMGPKARIQRGGAFRDSRESDETSSTRQLASTESSAATSSSSISGVNENGDFGPNVDSPGSSILEGDLNRLPAVPQFQYHHQQPPRVSSVPVLQEHTRNVSNPDLHDAATPVRRHLTPTSVYFRRDSLPRPQSSYSTFSDMGPRGRSPGLMPGGGSHLRAPSSQSRKSPDNRSSTYAELLNVPYPQQAPAPVALDNSNLRTVVGNNASLLSTQKTLEMYRQNVKKTTDFSIQYSFAVFLISTAQEQGLDFSDTKAAKNSSPAPLRDHESPIIEVSVTGPQELVREARHILQRLSSGGYPFAQYYLADGFASGLFNKGKEDYSSAFPLFVLAGKHGHAESAYRTALCYEFGWGCRKDAAKAVQYLRSAASKRHPGAMTRLGKACLSGDLGEKRYREGVKWLKLATEAADIQYNAAPYQLGCLYETGYGDDVFQDLNYAAELFTQAADLGHPEANFRMGDAYEHGRLNCPRDPALSVHFYTGAAEREHAGAMMGLCAWYMVGAPPILDKDEEEAYEWARRSAELGR